MRQTELQKERRAPLDEVMSLGDLFTGGNIVAGMWSIFTLGIDQTG